MDAVSYSLASKQAQRIEKFIENPDSTSGIVTVPKVIASGETITIPAGRVAVLPNVQVDGVMNIEGEVFVPSGATTADLDNRIGLKADTTYVNTQLSLKANTADLKEIGVGQTWQDLTASRALGTTYTNTTGKPIVVNIDQQPNSAYTYFQFYINSVSVATLGANTTYSVYPNFTGMIVPNGATYSISGGALNKWMELR